MKLAARFPVTSFKPLIVFFWLVHLMLLLIAFYLIGLVWSLLVILLSISVSFYFTFKQYQKITQASDDLCWNGNSWLMQAGKSSKKKQTDSVIYLKISADSWVSKQLSLLHFSSETATYSWLFARAELGERLYSHLVYLVRQDIKQNLKQEKKPTVQ